MLPRLTISTSLCLGNCVSDKPVRIISFLELDIQLVMLHKYIEQNVRTDCELTIYFLNDKGAMCDRIIRNFNRRVKVNFIVVNRFVIQRLLSVRHVLGKRVHGSWTN